MRCNAANGCVIKVRPVLSAHRQRASMLSTTRSVSVRPSGAPNLNSPRPPGRRKAVRRTGKIGIDAESFALTNLTKRPCRRVDVVRGARSWVQVARHVPWRAVVGGQSQPGSGRGTLNGRGLHGWTLGTPSAWLRVVRFAELPTNWSYQFKEIGTK